VTFVAYSTYWNFFWNFHEIFMQYFIEIFTPTKFHEILHHYTRHYRHVCRQSAFYQVVKVIWRIGRIAAAHGQLSRIRQVVPMCTPHLTHASLDHLQSTSQAASGSVQPFCTADSTESPYTLQCILCLCMWESGLPSNTQFLGHTRVHNPSGISVSSAVFPRLAIATDRQTTPLRL